MEYSLADYSDMLRDDVRVTAYSKALEKIVGPDTTVLDIGCGSGYFCLLACKLGARHVYGIDPNEATYMAEKLLAANGFSDRATLYNQYSNEVTLPEKVDVIVSDLRGALPLYGNHFDIIEDARTRFLKPGGVLIPQSDQLYMAPVSDEEMYNTYTGLWMKDLGFDFSPLIENFRNQWQSVTLSHDSVKGIPECWAELNYTQPLPERMEKTATWTYDNALTLHGIGVWFDCSLLEDARFSANPAAEERPSVYGNAFFPFQRPLDMSPGDNLEITLRAYKLHGSFVMEWATACTQNGITTRFTQSPITAEVPSKDLLHRRADNYRPAFNVFGKIDLCILTRLNEGATLGDIAHELAKAFPDQFSSWHKALTHVGDIAMAYDSPPSNSATE